MLRPYLTLLLTLLALTPMAYAANNDQSKAAILAYQHIGQPQNAQSNLSRDLFQSHLNEIKGNDYTILPLPQIIEALRNNAPLPSRTIAITFDAPNKSTYQNAIKALINENIPFTIFIASQTTKIPSYLNWKTLKKISKYNGASFGILPAHYAHINQHPKSEATRLINKSRIKFKDKMGFEANLFSYPYGETSALLKNIIQIQGFAAAFGLHSGPAHANSDMLALPRFTMTNQYGDLDRFRMITNTAPLPIKEVGPQNWQLSAPLTQIGFTASPALTQTLSALSCHITGQQKPTIEIIENRVEIIPTEPINNERTRLNCTLPVHNDNNNNEKQWRWLGMLFHTPEIPDTIE